MREKKRVSQLVVLFLTICFLMFPGNEIVKAADKGSYTLDLTSGECSFSPDTPTSIETMQALLGYANILMECVDNQDASNEDALISLIDLNEDHTFDISVTLTNSKPFVLTFKVLETNSVSGKITPSIDEEKVSKAAKEEDIYSSVTFVFSDGSSPSHGKGNFTIDASDGKPVEVKDFALGTTMMFGMLLPEGNLIDYQQKSVTPPTMWLDLDRNGTADIEFKAVEGVFVFEKRPTNSIKGQIKIDLTPEIIEGLEFDAQNGGGEYYTSVTFVMTRFINNAVIMSIPDQTYTGSEIKPEPVIKYDSATLTNGADYDVSYKDNINVGTATMVITGKGNYSGTLSITFKIKDASKVDPSTIPAVGTSLVDDAGTFIYRVTSNTAADPCAAYTGATGQKASVTIPDTVTINSITYKVTSIAPNAFKGNKKLKKVTIGANVEEIGKKAFYGCTKLTTVNCKSKVLKKIGTSAFQGDKKLNKITLKTTLLKKGTVGKNAFKGTSAKLQIKVPAKAKKAYKKFFKNKGNKKVTIK